MWLIQIRGASWIHIVENVLISCTLLNTIQKTKPKKGKNNFCRWPQQEPGTAMRALLSRALRAAPGTSLGPGTWWGARADPSRWIPGEFHPTSARSTSQSLPGPELSGKGWPGTSGCRGAGTSPLLSYSPQPVLGRSLPGAPLELGHIHIGTAWCTQTGIPLQERAKKQVCLKRGSWWFSSSHFK